VAATGVSTTAHTTYDALGRVTAYNRQTAGQSYTMSAVYYKAGLMTDESYPSSRVVHTEYDGAVTGKQEGVRLEAIVTLSRLRVDLTERSDWVTPLED
jgi:hypothetical protein